MTLQLLFHICEAEYDRRMKDASGVMYLRHWGLPALASLIDQNSDSITSPLMEQKPRTQELTQRILLIVLLIDKQTRTPRIINHVSPQVSENRLLQEIHTDSRAEEFSRLLLSEAYRESGEAAAFPLRRVGYLSNVSCLV
ncbi:hypothetical protein AVEN_839-1 [Araneus ventricosus]|uniref:Uncharacterized protein n=1 Tax=Araneus ventricosus TaxID=182803 RepID=A0A4Y2NBG0_ARAVE|nr:hypothetical protein AVEN_50397-1 [Araneus ventricosus]GBN36739.1 hypothetical protein AVEN_839-1 [Araneus ventricosus]